MKHYEMKRKDREVTDHKWIESVLNRGVILHLGLAGEDGQPYVVPLGYGYRDNVIYLHGAVQGRKNDLADANPKVCFQVTLDAELVPKETGAGFTMKYRSVTGFGRIRSLTDLNEKNTALQILMDHYNGPHQDLNETNHANVWVARIDIDSMTGKNNLYPL